MSALAAGRFRLAPALTAVVLTVLLLWLFGTAAEIFLLLFISVLISLYLSAGADVIQRHTGMPRRHDERSRAQHVPIDSAHRRRRRAGTRQRRAIGRR